MRQESGVDADREQVRLAFESRLVRGGHGVRQIEVDELPGVFSQDWLEYKEPLLDSSLRNSQIANTKQRRGLNKRAQSGFKLNEVVALAERP